jgi:hypothetical protein
MGCGHAWASCGVEGGRVQAGWDFSNWLWADGVGGRWGGAGAVSRIRTIKPEFWAHPKVVECSTNARLMFIGLWNFCDDAGRHAFSPKQIKMEIFPGDNFATEDILRMLDELSSNGLLIVYRVDNKDILQVTGWEHQKIDHPQKAKFPGPIEEHSSNDQRMLAPESTRRDPIGRDGSSSSRARATTTTTTRKIKFQLPENEGPNEQQLVDAEKHGLTEAAAIEAEWLRFRDYNRAKGSALSDWNAAWRRWLDKRAAFAGHSNGGSKPRAPPPAPGQNRLRTKSGLWVDNKFYPD